MKAYLYDELSPVDRRIVRDIYIKEQGGNCYHCNKPLNGPPSREIDKLWINWGLFPPNFGRYPVHLHHSRETGLTIGAVHAKCNAALWQYHGE